MPLEIILPSCYAIVMTVLTEAILIIFSFLFVFLWQSSPLSSYTIPFLGFLIFVYLLVSAKSKKLSYLNDGGNKSVIVLNTAILLFIVSTNGLHSPLFFLLYFILFGIAFVFRPIVVLVYVLAITGLFYPQLVQGDFINNVLKIGSLYLIAPLAFYFGTQYKKQEKTSQEVQHIEEEAEEVLENEPNMSQEDKSKLEEVILEAENIQNEK